MDVWDLINNPYDKKKGNLYVDAYIQVFPLKNDLSRDCEACFRDAYNKLKYFLNKKESIIMAQTKYQFTGKENTEYNFPSLKIFGLKAENFTDAIGDVLVKNGKGELVKEIKEKPVKGE